MKKKLEEYFDRLWPICRSITGDGLRESFQILQDIIPLQIHEIPTGTKVFDWEIPKEWNIRDAWIKTPSGRKIAKLSENNLHVLNYSIPVNKELTLEELKKHIYTLDSQKDAIPYVTSYYKEQWGFCMSSNELESLPKEGLYHAYIDSDLKEGHLSYADVVLKGDSDKEILFSSYLCHPSMANNELSGPLAQAFLYKKIASLKHRKYTYRFVFAPETIGVIAYLDKYGKNLIDKMDAGFVLTCCGDNGKFNYKKSKQECSLTDRITEHVLKYSNKEYSIRDFSVGGSDERQYCSPGFNLPVGSLMRTPYQEYKEYHTSLDNKDFINFEALEETVDMYFEIVQLLEYNQNYYNKIQFCEPQLGKRGLYPDSATPDYDREELHRLLHFLSFADGETSLVDIAEKRNECASKYFKLIDKCKEKGLI